ncbi:MAG: FtsX-like permease family protein, partial [Phycisphaerales bacterium]|nr:FtsX-like permease family protein [Phycisphaerales bacterium]
MSGFSTKLRERLHGLLWDVVIESQGMEGFADPLGKMERIRNHPVLGPEVQAMARTVEVFAMLQFHYPGGEPVTRPVRLLGVDPKERVGLGGFDEHLHFADKRTSPSFDLPEEHRRAIEEREKWRMQLQPLPDMPANPEEPPPPDPPPSEIKIPKGVILGNLIATFRRKDVNDEGKEITKEVPILDTGDPVILTTVGGAKLVPVYDRFVVVGRFKSEMSEYDANYVFVALDYLQHLRSMQDRVTSLQIKLRDYDADKKEVVAALRQLFENEAIRVNTWEEKQGPLLAAISIEKGILNVLLFLIIAVAGFGILAIFSMIVAEKTRDIGILKALGASNGGVMKIFLSYGLALGLVGATLGTALGVWLTVNINGVEQFLSRVTGSELFDRGIYYFNEIPTDLQIPMLVYVNLGAILIAVLFSVLPALRAALLHPVRALRY